MLTSRRSLLPLRWVCGAGCFVLLVACGGDESSNATPDAGDVSDTVSADGTGDATGPVFALCEDNTDCRGGEVCRGGECREACGDDNPCDGDLAVCDESAGYCVGCLDNADCPDGVCSSSTRSCVDAECRRDADCRGGTTCRAGACVPIDPVVCTGGAQSCSGNTVVRCNRDGTGETRETCDAGTSCLVDGGVARCAAPLCAPFSIGCATATSAFVCNDDGTEQEVLPCNSGQVCREGACVRPLCEPGTSACDGDTLLVCGEDGLTQRALSCDDTPACAETTQGCACSGGACEPRVCAPGSASCVGPGRRVCSEDGLSLGAFEACAEETTCVRGACIDDRCTPGSTTCAGTTLLTCNGSGTGYNETACSDSGSACVGSTGSATCVALVCTPRATNCTGDGRTVLRCNTDGTNETRENCAAGTFCEAGSCVAQACTPGTRRCTSGNVFACDARGTGFDLAETCDAGEVCQDGTCVTSSTAECTSGANCPAPARFCDGSTAVSYSGNGRCTSGSCDYTSVTTRTNCTAGGNVCRDGRCVSPPTSCTSNEDCAGGGICANNDCYPNPADCTSDSQCQTIATALGSTRAADARCDSTVGCFVLGRCGPSDIFASTCRSTATCGLRFGIGGGGLDAFDACTPCNTSTNAGCRTGETCREGGFLDTTPYCAASGGGGGLPFPFP